jgi:DNA-directed RNA polymerase sigma subunit (sigma70/sigma32)
MKKSKPVRTYAEIGDAIRLSTIRVQQIEQQALRKGRA